MPGYSLDLMGQERWVLARSGQATSTLVSTDVSGELGAQWLQEILPS